MAGRVGTNQDLVARVSWDGARAMGPGDALGQRVEAVVDDPNQIRNGVSAGVAGPVLNSECFAGAVSETRDRVEPDPALV